MTACRRASAAPPVLIFVLSLFSAPDGLAQTGRLEGRLVRPDGGGVRGATVLTSSGLQTMTDADGRFVLEPLPDGVISVTFSLGPDVLTIDDVRIAGAPVRIERTVEWNAGFAEAITVYAASRRMERLFEAPASVAVVSEEAIASEAPSAQLPRVLAATPGIQLAQSGMFDFNVNIRGLNSALTRRVLTLIDGRDPASVLIGAQEWAAFGLPLDELARIEVVRGPGAALYGTNAFNGVIDMTTRLPRDARGGRAEVSIGEGSTVRFLARHAGGAGGGMFYRVHASYGRTDDFFAPRVATVEYAGVPLEVRDLARDRSAFVSAGGRVDRHLAGGGQLTAEGAWAHTDGNVFLTGAGRIQNTGAHRPWVRSAFQDGRWRVAGYYDGRYGEMVSLAAGPTIVDRSMKASAEASRLFQPSPSSRLVAGGAYRFLRADTRDGSGRSTILRDVERAHERSAFAQLDYQLTQRLELTVAARLDDSTLHSPEVSPKAALVWAPVPVHSVRASYGHAFQTGSLVHYFNRAVAAPPVSALAAVEAGLRPFLGGVPLGFDSVPVLAVGNERLQVERVDSFEAGYSGVVGPRILVGAAYYFNRVENLITPLIPQTGTELGRVNPQFGPYGPPAALGPAQRLLVLSTLAANVPPALLANLSNDTDGAPVFVVASYTNLPRAHLQGGEVGIQYFASDRLTTDIGYSALRFTPERALEDPLVTANAPPHMLTAGVTYAGPTVAASVRYRWSDAFSWNGGVYRGRVPASSIVDITVRYNLGSRTAIQLNVANLLDHEHYEAFGGDILHRRALLTMVQRW